LLFSSNACKACKVSLCLSAHCLFIPTPNVTLQNRSNYYHYYHYCALWYNKEQHPCPTQQSNSFSATNPISHKNTVWSKQPASLRHTAGVLWCWCRNTPDFCSIRHQEKTLCSHARDFLFEQNNKDEKWWSYLKTFALEIQVQSEHETSWVSSYSYFSFKFQLSLLFIMFRRSAWLGWKHNSTPQLKKKFWCQGLTDCLPLQSVLNPKVSNSAIVTKPLTTLRWARVIQLPLLMHQPYQY